MYHFKDQLLPSDRQYIFQNLADVEEFLHTKTVQYIRDWIVIWYPFFKKGIKDGQTQAIAGVRPITSYFQWKTTASRAKLPPRFSSRYDGLKRDAKQKRKKYNQGK
eukprot:5148549-Ditylum_brightwellii.AAC.1